MERLMDFLSMGGYGAYIWPSYLIAAVVLLWLLIGSLRSVRGLEARLKSLRQARFETPEEKT
jgi:heme exporter protein D